jgi:UDPglucose--hexose-1-phosphate uridylyltransferase
VPNKFPALAGELGRQEVVVHTPRHAVSLAELTGDELVDVAKAWRARATAARAEGFRYLQAVVNEGPEAGASLEHGHSQLAWLPEAPPAVARERETATGRGCPVCTLAGRELRAGSRIVLEEHGLALLSAYAARAPYELLVVPLACEADAFASDRLAGALRLAAEAVRRLRAVEGHVPLNAWLHTADLGGSQGHWHLELLPRLTVFAGLELGAELYVNPLAPETAAERLRAAAAPGGGP